jgi:hypothetical protein
VVTEQGDGGTALGVAVTTRPTAQKPSSLEKSGGAPLWGGDDRGGASLQFPCSLDKTIMHTGHASATPFSAALGRGQVSTCGRTS